MNRLYEPNLLASIDNDTTTTTTTTTTTNNNNKQQQGIADDLGKFLGKILVK